MSLLDALDQQTALPPIQPVKKEIRIDAVVNQTIVKSKFSDLKKFPEKELAYNQ